MKLSIYCRPQRKIERQRERQRDKKGEKWGEESTVEGEV